MYRSPFELVMKDMGAKAAECLDELVFKAACDVGVRVDKAELLLALQYDRDQYDKGFADGRAAAMDELVLCKDCKHGKTWKNAFGIEGFKCDLLCVDLSPEAFCSYGERRSDG